MSRDIINGRYDIEYLPTQQRVCDCISSFSVPNIMLAGGYGSGKSRFIGEMGWELSLIVPGIEIIYWRKTRTAIYDTTYRLFLEQVIPEKYIRKHDKSHLTVITKNNSRFDFLGMDKVTRKGSYWADVIFLDESIEFEEPELKMIEGRLRGKHVKTPLLIYATNPGAPGSYQHKLFVQNEEKPGKERNPNFKYFAQTSFENVHNPPDYFTRLRQWEGSQYYSRFVLSLWTAFTGSVYEQFDPAIHVIEPFEIPYNWPKKISVDFGYDHPLVVLWIATDPGTGAKYVYRQFCKTRQLVKRACEICKGVTEDAHEEIEAARADHDAENRAQFEEYWMATEPAVKTVKAGIQHVQERLIEQPNGKRGLYIFNDAWAEREGFWYGNFDRDMLLHEEGRPENLQDEFPGYRWGKNDTPVKEGDDCLDALRYDEETDRNQATKEEGLYAAKIYRPATYGRQ